MQVCVMEVVDPIKDNFGKKPCKRRNTDVKSIMMMVIVMGEVGN